MRDARGFTLIEVLIALAILAGVIGSLLVLTSQHTRQAARLEERMLARIVAENSLANFIAARQTNRDADLQGDAEISGVSFRFEIERRRAPIQGFELVTTEVRQGRDGQVLATLTTLQRAQI